MSSSNNSQQQSPIADQPSVEGRRGLKILAAEDSPTNALLLKTVLEKRCDHQVTIAKDGQEAVDLCATNVFDLLIFDIRMPVLDGLEALARVRQDEFNRQTPALALTADVMPDRMEVYRKNGFAIIVEKPFQWDTLKAAIDRVCGPSH